MKAIYTSFCSYIDLIFTVNSSTSCGNSINIYWPFKETLAFIYPRGSHFSCYTSIFWLGFSVNEAAVYLIRGNNLWPRMGIYNFVVTHKLFSFKATFASLMKWMRTSITSFQITSTKLRRCWFRPFDVGFVPLNEMYFEMYYAKPVSYIEFNIHLKGPLIKSYMLNTIDFHLPGPIPGQSCL